MSLAYRQGRVKMAIKALKEVRDIANANIDRWRDMEEEDLMSNQKDIIGAQSLMESKLSTLDIAMDKFLLEADKIDDSDPIAQGKIDESSTKVIEAVDEANKVLDQVLVQVKRIAAANQKRTTPETPSLSHQQQQPVIIHSESRLDYKPPRFKGNKWEFENFWTLYSATVENSGKSNTLKFNCLLNCLEGEPKEWISRFKINDENYPQAVELLKKKYNDKEQIISDLTNQIQKEAAPSTSITDQRKLFEKLFIMTAQLKDYQENIETRMFKDQIVQKFSKSIQSELYKKKIDMDSTEWTVDQIMKDLETIISREEELNKLMKRSDSEHQNKPKTQSFKKDSKKDESDSRKTSSKKCTFCKQEGHWGSNCKVHSSPKERIEILKAENRCFLCTRYGHSIDACRAKACSNCQKNHHFSICNSKNDDSALHKKQSEPKAKTQSSNGSYKPKVQAVFVQTLQDDGSFHDSSRDETKENCMRPEKKENVQRVMPTASSVNKDDLETFIPTIQVKAFNPKKNCWETMSLMLDSGASQTYADMKMFKEWNLPDKGQKTVWNRVFGSAQSTVNTYQKTAVRIQLGQGILDMDIFVSDHLVGRIPKSKLSMEDMKFIIQNALVMNQDSLKSSCQPQIILGCDYMSQIMTGEFITLPSGISALGTACGLTTMGRSASKIKKKEQHLLMVIKDSNQGYTFSRLHQEQKERGISERVEFPRDKSAKSENSNGRLGLSDFQDSAKDPILIKPNSDLTDQIDQGHFLSHDRIGKGNEPEVTCSLFKRPAATSLHPHSPPVMKEDEEGPVNRNVLVPKKSPTRDRTPIQVEDSIPPEAPDQKVSRRLASRSPSDKSRRRHSSSSSSFSSSSSSFSSSSSNRTSRRHSRSSKHESNGHATRVTRPRKQTDNQGFRLDLRSTNGLTVNDRTIDNDWTADNDWTSSHPLL
ncbi:hypothetical protein CRE_21583 [Caenorhabditis remanei]|uniref:CCHC-type domain-containing protein n=1 Tax=Caenorhabditis remanei TaxID=31234 RepID=E3NJ07_CAERE|nr:hypothetical protein CRE_21583 [Caenorhabditis remanei]